MTTDAALERLTASETELLLLLGRGHTAKSIAALKGLSELAVNERFRSARRKTGIGSSREIARLLVAQENRHDFIGLADAPPELAPSPRPDAAPARPASFFRRWRFPMAVMVVLAAAAFLAQQTTAPPPSPAGNGLAGEILAQFPNADLADLNARVSSGPTDPAWSTNAEQRLAARYVATPNFDQTFETFIVRCSTDLCEAAGVARSGVSPDAAGTIMIELQTLGHTHPVPGLVQVVHHFNTSSDAASAFVAYWRRE